MGNKLDAEIGNIIKAVVVLLTILVAVGSIIVGIWEFIDEEPELGGLFLLIGIIGFPLISLFFYGFGTLVQNSCIIKEILKEQKKDTSNIIKNMQAEHKNGEQFAKANPEAKKTANEHKIDLPDL